MIRAPFYRTSSHRTIFWSRRRNIRSCISIYQMHNILKAFVPSKNTTAMLKGIAIPSFCQTVHSMERQESLKMWLKQNDNQVCEGVLLRIDKS